MIKSVRKFTGVYEKRDRYYVAWIEEIPGVNTQGATLEEAKENLKDALRLLIATNRALDRAAIKTRVQRAEVEVRV